MIGGATIRVATNPTGLLIGFWNSHRVLPRQRVLRRGADAAPGPRGGPRPRGRGFSSDRGSSVGWGDAVNYHLRRGSLPATFFATSAS